MKTKSHSLRGKAGFSMIEIISVLLLLGIVSAVVASRSASLSTYRLVADTETLKSYLRYAQLRAMSSNVSWGIRFQAGSYTLQRDGADTTYTLPNESSATHTMESGVSFSPVPGTITFTGCWGSPGTADQSIVLSAGGNTRTVTVEKNTGSIL